MIPACEPHREGVKVLSKLTQMSATVIVRILFAALSFFRACFSCLLLFVQLFEQLSALQEFLEFSFWFDWIGGKMSVQTDKVVVSDSSVWKFFGRKRAKASRSAQRGVASSWSHLRAWTLLTKKLVFSNGALHSEIKGLRGFYRQ